MHFLRRERESDGKSFSLLPVEIFYRETGKTKKVTEYPCNGKLLKAAEQVKTKYHTGRRGDSFRGSSGTTSLTGSHF